MTNRQRATACLPAILLLLAAVPATSPSGLDYRLEGDASQWDAKAHAGIVAAMDGAKAVYHLNAPAFSQTIDVTYSPATPTADANYNGHIRFGGQIGTRTALHEIAHILGVGTHPNWDKLVKDGKWTGPNAIRQLHEFDGPDAVLHADRQHFWPYGLNYDREGTTAETYRRNVLIVMALRQDLGIGSPVPPKAATQPARAR